MKLQDLGISTNVAKGFLTDILGQQLGNKFCGLVDSESPEQFDLEME